MSAIAALADTAPPTATTATYGAWTLGCAAAPQADGSSGPQACQITTRLNLKGQDGQVRPLLGVTIGQPAGAKTLRILLQVPLDVSLRAGVDVSLDQTGAASADANTPKPQDDILQLAYLTCAAQGCVADADAGDDLFQRLAGKKSVNVSFTALAGAKKIVVPVPLDGFGDALAALKANGK